MTPEAMARIHAAAITVPRPWTPAEIAALLARPGTFAVTDEHAFAIGSVTLDEAELLTLAVDPARQRQGLGRAILARFHREAAAHGATAAFLEVAADNLAARGLYGHAGYREAGRRRGYYRSGDMAIDALVLRRGLSGVSHG